MFIFIKYKFEELELYSAHNIAHNSNDEDKITIRDFMPGCF